MDHSIALLHECIVDESAPCVLLREMASCEARNRIWKLSTVVAASPDRVSAGQVVHEPKWDWSHPSEKLADTKSPTLIHAEILNLCPVTCCGGGCSH